MRLLVHGPSPHQRRRGVILLVVLSLLTLFALLGLSFVLVAGSQETSSRIAREAENRPATADLDPDTAFQLFMSQFLFDVNDDAAGVGSAMRGHSLARNMYGYNPAQLNDKPYNGVGRLHAATPYGSGVASTDAALMNYQYFAADGFIRHPERPGNAANPTAAQPAFVGGNVPYTYPDHNNFFLAEIDPNTGSVLVPSFHRDYLFGPLNLPATPPGMGAIPWPQPGANWNPNWTSPEGKYLGVRPTRALNPNFPMPGDSGGDVKNLDFVPGGNDSVWVDVGAPVLTVGGRKFKMMVAPLILALDGRVDLNVLGNIMGAGNTHRSHQGWGAWEGNLGQALNANPSEWTNLFVGSPAAGAATIKGRYDQGPGRGPTGDTISGGTSPRAWAQVDYNAKDDPTGNTPTGLRLPTPGSSASYMGFPSFAANTFGNGGATENPGHASIYNALRPRGTNRRFPIRDALQMLRFNGQGSDLVASDVMRLLPVNLRSDPGAARRRNLLTLLSADLERPGATPYLYDAAADPSRFKLLPVTGDVVYRPQAQPAQFPPLASAGAATPAAGEFDVSWRSRLAALLRLDLLRPLTPYTTNAANAANDRQAFAKDIFGVLRATTGGLDPQFAYDTYGKDSPEFRGLRYLAQLAANLVDQIDSDDVMTRFNWASFTAADTTVVNEFVFGVELPRLVIGETYVQYDNPAASTIVDPNNAANMVANPALGYNVNLWVELNNPMPRPAAADDTTATLAKDFGMGLVPVYRLMLADADLNGTATSTLRDPANVLGDPDFGTPAGTVPEGAGSRVKKLLTAWGAATDPQTVTPGGGQFNMQSATKNDAFYVIGPDTTALFLDPTKDSPNLPVTASSAKLTYNVPAVDANPKPRPTVVLQRLANPLLPPDPAPTSATYNPYVTVDFAESADAHVMDGRRFSTTAMTDPPASGVVTSRNSVGRSQPMAAALNQRLAQAPTFTAPAVAPTDQPKHTFFRQNSTVDTQAGLDAANADPTLKLPFDWLAHLDRYPTNPLELMVTSDARPHDLTQRFVTAAGMNAAAQQHLAPWGLADARLYRFFEFAMTRTPATGASPGGPLPGAGGRVVGKVNVNAIRGGEVFSALADAGPGNAFSQAQVDAAFNAMMNRRSPGGGVMPTDQRIRELVPAFAGQPLHRPFWSLALGQADAQADPFLRQDNPPGTRGLANTLFQSAFDPQPPAPPQAHPYLRGELLRKVYGGLTTRSNVFAVWATVGFFAVEDDTVTPPKLGAEMAGPQGPAVRYRMFSVIDRTQLQVWPTYKPDGTPTVSLAAPGVATPNGQPQPFALSANSYTRPDAATPVAPLPAGASASPYAWTLQQGAVLTVDPNTDNEETVVVTGAMAPFQGVFLKPHAANAPVVVRGNPGPLTRYDPRSDRELVPYYALID